MAISSFMASLNANILKIEKTINDKCYAIAIDLFLEIVKRTPSPSNPGDYAKGLLANQWYPKDGAGFSAEEGTSTSDTGSASRSRIRSLKGNQFLRKNGTVTLSNNVHYAFRAEYVGWPQPDWSGRVGPYAMVRTSLQLISARYR